MRRGAASLARALARWSGRTAATEPAAGAAAASGIPQAFAPAVIVTSTAVLPIIHGAARPPALPLGAAAYSTAGGPPSSPPPPPPPSAGTGVIDIHSVQDFQSVLALSQQLPVVLDCWATWCGPCKQLDPVLKAAVAATGGRAQLAKLDIDNPALAPLVAQMQVTSVPTMFLLFGGRMLDIKVGVPPQQELKSWIAEAVALAEEQLGPSAGGQQAQQAGQQDPKQLLEAGFAQLNAPGGRAADIAPLFGAVLEEATGADAGDRARALAGLAMCSLIDDPPSLATARDLVANAKEVSPPVVPDEVPRAEALVELAAEAQEAEADPRSIGELAAAAEANPRDLDARYLLALRQFAAGQHKEAIDTALGVVRVDRDWRQQGGKRLLLRFFDALGAGSELAKAGRRRLSNLWFM